MNLKINLIKSLNCSILLLAVLLVGCRPINQNLSVDIPSLQVNYPKLLEEAQMWQEDAYLDEAFIWLFSQSLSISTHFVSPAENLESFSVELLQDGTIRTKIITHEYPISFHETVEESDWEIDSQEALDLLLKATNLAITNSSQYNCSNLKLERSLLADSQPVVWSLTLSNCSTISENYYLDAKTGQLLDLSIALPTRFFTPTP